MHKKVISGKRERHELATFDENRRAVGMLNPMCDKNGSHVPGGRDYTLSVTTACPEDRRG